MSEAASPLNVCRSCKCAALRRASRAVTQHYEECFRGTGLRATQFTILATLNQTGPKPLTELATILGLERTSLTRNLRPLEKKGFVKAMAGDDQRVRRISITQAGEQAALDALGAWTRAQATVDEILRNVGVDEIFSR
jgi:DNA-binding MarR family transcriptional regulator